MPIFPRFKVKFNFNKIPGIGYEKGMCRRDPSDIIKVKDKYYVWYSKVKEKAQLYPSGYNAEIYYAVSQDEGYSWNEKGIAIRKNETGFDSFGVFTPNILIYEEKYYLYYIVVKKGFRNLGYSEQEKTYIAVAYSSSPDGPWHEYEKNPILSPSKEHKKFDSFRIDDSAFIIRKKEIWLYYKGRQWNKTPRETKMGAAIAKKPLGPFERVDNGDFLQDSGHEVLVWPYQKGVLSLVSEVGKNGRTLQFAEDGRKFRVFTKIPKTYPQAPGIFRNDFNSESDIEPKDKKWGISMIHGKDPYLIRYDMKIKQKGLIEQ